MNERTECEKLPGRLRRICEGTASIPLDKVNIYRSNWGLEPLEELPQPLPMAVLATNRGLEFKATPIRSEGVKKAGCGGCGGSRALPSLAQQAINYGKALARHALNPGKLPEVEVKRRLQVCEGCEWFRPEDRRCAHTSCGCFLDVKATWASESCPIGGWPKIVDVPPSTMEWAYGVTTVPKRRQRELPVTLESLKAAGFDKPRLFIDGAKDDTEYAEFGLETTCRWPTIRTFGNWVLGLIELYIRQPNADRYAIFQDDFVTYRNLKAYLEQIHYPEKGYLNLYTFPENQRLAPPNHTGWYEANQRGLGAVALVFNREAVVQLLSNDQIVGRPIDPNGYKRIDGGFVTAFNSIGWKEYVHNPSLVQHTGLVSSMGNARHKLADSFRGEQFNALELL